MIPPAMHKNNRQNRLPCVWDNKGNMENLMFDDNADPVAIDSMISCFDPKGSGACQLETFAQQAEQANSPLRTHIRALVLAVVVFVWCFSYPEANPKSFAIYEQRVAELVYQATHATGSPASRLLSKPSMSPSPAHNTRTLAHSHTRTRTLHSPRGRRRG